MEEIYSSGKARAVGVCNFNIKQLEDLMAHSKIVPAVNQVEMHPHLSQVNPLKICQSQGIQMEAWRQIMMGEVLDIPELIEIRARHNKSPAQVTLR
ncbi:MAG: hypothetical protein Alis3KO_15550 [Aliiglaciecola sp.]